MVRLLAGCRRTRVLAGACAVNGLSTFASALVTNIWALRLMRAVNGAGVWLFTWPPHHHNRLTNLGYNNHTAGLAIATPTILSIATDLHKRSSSRYALGYLSLAGGLGAMVAGLVSTLLSGVLLSSVAGYYKGSLSGELGYKSPFVPD